MLPTCNLLLNTVAEHLLCTQGASHQLLSSQLSFFQQVELFMERLFECTALPCLYNWSASVKTAATRGVLAGWSRSMERGSISQAQVAQWNARQHWYGKACIVVLGDPANRRSRTEAEQAVGRSALRMLHSVQRVPMVPEREFVWRSQSSNCFSIRDLSLYPSFLFNFLFSQPNSSLSPSSQVQAEEYLLNMCLHLHIQMHHVYLCAFVS